MELTSQQHVEIFLNKNKEINPNNAKDIQTYLFPFAEEWSTFKSEVYALIIGYIGESYNQLGNTSTAITFLEEHIIKYAKLHQYAYSSKSMLYYHLGVYYSKEKCEDKGLEAFKKHVFYLLIDNNRFNDYEFYSFRSCSEYSLKDLSENTLSTTNPTKFNDPMDCLVYSWLKNKQALTEDNEDVLTAKLLMKAFSYIKIRCFVRNTPLPTEKKLSPTPYTSVPEQYNLLMWGHYTNNHEGFCIKYKFPLDIVYEDTSLYTLTRLGTVNYIDKVSINNDSLTLIDAFFKKSKVWSYENEVRLLHYDPFVEDAYKKIKLPDNCVKEIYFGLKCSDANKQKIREALATQKVDFYQIICQPDDFYHLSSEKV